MDKTILENGETVADGSMCGYDSLHQLLSANLKPELYQVKSPSKLVTDLDSWFYYSRYDLLVEFSVVPSI